MFRDMEDDVTRLVDHRQIGNMPRGARSAILSETPANYDKADNTASFSNPLYEAGKAMVDDGDCLVNDSDDDDGLTHISN